ncbi:MAG: toll/interleukin-1 receptor domain-containing protein, partial [Pseudomonadota bacterium]
MHDVFISYSRTDKPFVERLYGLLEVSGRDAWVDWKGIPISAEWMQEIYRGIDACHTFVFVISPDSVTSETCRLETARAVARQKRIIPVMARAVMPEALPGDLSGIQYISFVDGIDFEGAFQGLVDALDTDLNWVRKHARLLLRAEEWNAHDRDAGYLLQGSVLAAAESWLREAATKKQKPLPLHRQFLVASRENARRRRRRRLGWIAGSVVIISVIGGYAFERAESAREERALKLTAHANLSMFRNPGKAYATALLAKTTDPEVIDAARSERTALGIIQQRVDLAARDRENWDTGSPFIPLAGAFFKGRLTARISADGRYVLLATERGETGNDPPGDAYLFDNESLRATKLEPPERRDRIKRRLEYAGFGNSGRKIYLARQFNVEIYDLQGRFEKEFYVSSTKYPITIVDGVREDGLLVIGDSTGPVWLVDVMNEKTEGKFFRYNTYNPLVSFAVSPSGRTAVLLLRSGEVFLWHIGEGAIRPPVQIPHEGKAIIALFKPSEAEETWLVGGEDGVVVLWTIADGQAMPVATFEHRGEPIGYATFQEELKRLIIFSDSGKPRIWDTETG